MKKENAESIEHEVEVRADQLPDDDRLENTVKEWMEGYEY